MNSNGIKLKLFFAAVISAFFILFGVGNARVVTAQAEYAASINSQGSETKYLSLQEAIGVASENDKIDVLKNLEECIVVPEGGVIYIDLNGNFLNCQNTTIINNGNLIIDNGEVIGKNVGIENNGVLTLGIKDGVYSFDELLVESIEGAGIKNVSGVINWYDGLVKSVGQSNIGSVAEFETGYKLVENTFANEYNNYLI